MVTVKEQTTLVGISELRTKAEAIVKLLGHSTVILERRHKPVAVLVPMAKYEALEAAFEFAEDHFLVEIAKARLRRTPRKAYLSLEEVERRVGLR